MASNRRRLALELAGLVLGLAAVVLLSVGLYRACAAGVSSLVKGTGSQLESLAAELVSKNIELFYGNRIVKATAVESTLSTIQERFSAPAGRKLTGLEPKQWRLMVVDDPTINAVSLPGGLIIVYGGLIKILNSPEELAAVIAHEVGHVANGDVAEALVRQLAVGVLTAALGDPNGSAQSIISDLLETQFTKQAEFRADELAAQLLMASGLSPRHLAAAFAAMERAESPLAKLQLPFLNDHPATPERIERATELAKEFNGPEASLGLDWAQFRRAIHTAEK